VFKVLNVRFSTHDSLLLIMFNKF